jgi:hypothetical protein
MTTNAKDVESPLKSATQYQNTVLDVIVERLCKRFLPLYPLFSKVMDGEAKNDKPI